MPQQPAEFGINFRFCYTTPYFTVLLQHKSLDLFFKLLKPCRKRFVSPFFCVEWVSHLFVCPLTSKAAPSLQHTESSPFTLSTRVNMNLSSWTAQHSGLLPADIQPLLTWCNFRGITWLLSIQNLTAMSVVPLWAWEKPQAYWRVSFGWPMFLN